MKKFGINPQAESCFPKMMDPDSGNCLNNNKEYYASLLKSKKYLQGPVFISE